MHRSRDALRLPRGPGADSRSYRFWRRPTLGTPRPIALWLALATLTRSEGLMLAVSSRIPTSCSCAGVDTSAGSCSSSASIAAVGLVVVGPWVVRNLTTFERHDDCSATDSVASSLRQLRRDVLRADARLLGATRARSRTTPRSPRRSVVDKHGTEAGMRLPLESHGPAARRGRGTGRSHLGRVPTRSRTSSSTKVFERRGHDASLGGPHRLLRWCSRSRSSASS